MVKKVIHIAEKLDCGITIEDINNNIELNVYSGFGGMFLHTIKISKLEGWLKNNGRTLNRDFFLRKN